MPDLQTLIDQLVAARLHVVLFQLILVLIATLIALRFAHITVNAAINRLFAREATEGTAQDVPQLELERRRDTLEGLTYRGIRILILIIAFLMALQVLRLDIGPAIAGLGIVGLALSLGAQHLVRDYVAGAFVLIENQYSKGDYVAIAGVTGTVEDVSLRRTTLRDLDGTVHYVPHGLIQTASNLTRNWAGIDLDVPVPYEQDLGPATEAINAAGARLAEEAGFGRQVLQPPHVARVERLAEAGLVVKVLGSVAPQVRFEAAGALRQLIVEEAEQRNVVIGWRSVPAEESGGADGSAAPKRSRTAEDPPPPPLTTDQ